MRIRLGINTCFAVKRWPRPEDWAPVVRDRLGLRLVQHSFDLVANDSPVADAARLGDGVRAAGLELHSTFTGLAAYSDNLLAHPDPVRRASAMAWYRRAIDGLGELARHARAAGLAYLMVENLAAAREPSTMAMIRDLLDDGDAERVPIRLCLDVGHMCVPGTRGEDRDPYAWLRELGSVAPVIQLQQSDANGDHHWPFTADRNAEGRIDADRVLEALDRSGAAATDLILEVIPPFEQDDASVIADLEASAAYWRAALERHGVTA